MKATELNEEQLRKLALDMVDGRIFHDQMCPENMVTHVFMPLMFVTVAKEDSQHWGLVYEYMSEAGPRTLNGFPMFMSMRVLHVNNLPRLNELTKALRDQRTAWLKGDSSTCTVRQS